MKFRLNETFLVDTDESPWKTEGLRIGLWGGSGSGKSNTAALLGEQFLSQGGAVVIFEPRAEYHTLKEKWDVVVCGGPYAKDIDFIPTSPSTYAKAVVEEGVSLIFYSTDVEDETKLIEFVSRFLHYLLKYNETVKRPIMLIVEETDEYAPISTKGHVSPPWVFSRMIRSFTTASRDARKLNIVPIYISPRPQGVNFTIRQLCNLTFYGKFAPQDVHYIETQCLKYYEHSFYRGQDLLNLKTGQFAIITSGQTLPLQTITQPRLTRHGAETPKLTYIAPHKEETKQAVETLTKTITEALEHERLELSELDKEREKTRKLEELLTDQKEEIGRLRTALEVAGKLTIQTPEGVSKEELLKLQIERDEAYSALHEIHTITKGRLKGWREEEHLGEKTLQKTYEADKLYDTWAPKMPSKCARRILKFLLDNRGAKYTKAQLGMQLGYAKSGTFNSALSFLRRNGLIKMEKNLVWTEG